MKRTTLVLVALFSLSGEALAAPSPAAKAAKVSRAQAARTALATVPGGTIREGELEREHGKLLWSFDIARSGTRDITEVQVDAVTGKTVSVTTESPAQERREKTRGAGKTGH